MRKQSRPQLRYNWLFLIICIFLLSISTYDLSAQNNDDIIQKALKDELTRSMNQLQLEDMEKPYYIEYAVEDTKMLSMRAVFGSIVNLIDDKSRILRVIVKVGDYDFDNTGFISQRSMYASMGSIARQLAEENDYYILRRDIWLATDSAYKQALEQLASKRSFIKTKVQEEEIPDFSREDILTSISPRKSIEFNEQKWEEVLRSLSKIFREYPLIYDSSLDIFLKVTNKYYINSEGTSTRQPVTLFSLLARASTQAPDGMGLKNYVPFYGTSFETLPTENEMRTAIQKMAKELTALTSAPVLDNYIGPVLMTGEASAEVFAQILAPQLSGERPPLLEQQRMASYFSGSKLANRLNRRILPSFFNVVDDPRQPSFGKYPLIGTYKVDDQGIPVEPITIVEEGILKSLLLSRRPRKKDSKSNGHGRSMPFSSQSAQIGNLFIKTTNGKTDAELKKELIELCKDEGLEFGLMIKKLDNPSISGRGPSAAAYMTPGRTQKETVTAPLLVYKVTVEDGSEELVRGLMVDELSIRTLRDITAAGKDYFVNNRYVSGGGFAASLGGSPAMGIPTTVIAPSILFEEIELNRPKGPQQKPALLKHPYFKK